MWAATRIRPVLAGRVPDSIETPQPRHAMDRWPERLGGRVVERVDTHGKHLFIRFGPLAVQARQDRADRMSSGWFEGGLVLHSHLRMTGAWSVRAVGARWSRPPRRAWLVVRAGDQDVIQFDGPVLELMTEGRVRFDQRIAGLGPDVLATSFDGERFLRRLREDDPGRAFGDALLDQRLLAGIGNIWKSEGCWEAAISPWRALRDVSDAEAMAFALGVRPRMLRSGLEGPRTIEPRVYGRRGGPCPRCGGRITARPQGDDNRLTYWCPGCQV
jgi:endonuclease-8